MSAEKALTYKEFGERVECDYTTVSRLFSGHRAPSTRLLGRICRAFDLDEGQALRVLRVDQDRNDGFTTRFAAWLRERTIADTVSERT